MGPYWAGRVGVAHPPHHPHPPARLPSHGKNLNLQSFRLGEGCYPFRWERAWSLVTLKNWNRPKNSVPMITGELSLFKCHRILEKTELTSPLKQLPSPSLSIPTLLYFSSKDFSTSDTNTHLHTRMPPQHTHKIHLFNVITITPHPQ